jgi:hypothetical protein
MVTYLLTSRQEKLPTTVIRKLSVGPDYKTAMHYIIGQKVINDQYVIHAIIAEVDSIKVWIENDKKEVVAWKSYNFSIPMSVEYNINF